MTLVFAFSSLFESSPFLRGGAFADGPFSTLASAFFGDLMACLSAPSVRCDVSVA